MKVEQFLPYVMSAMKILPRAVPDLSDEKVLLFWFDSFKEFDFKAFKDAVDKLLKNGKFFPTINEILSELQPEFSTEEKGRMIETRLITAIGKYGYCNESQAREYIGELGWQAMLKFSGSWINFCDLKEITTYLRTEIRHLANIVVKQEKLGLLKPEQVHEIESGNANVMAITEKLSLAVSNKTENKSAVKLQELSFDEIVQKK